MTTMRAKMQVSQVQEYFNGENGAKSQETLNFHAVCGDWNAEGYSEDNTYARYTPGGTLSICVANPELWGKFKHGDKFYLDFSPAKKDPQAPQTDA